MPLYNHQPLKIYNSLSGEKEPFVPVHEGNVGMYVCGPTVYSNVHLGNVRTFMSFDVIFRYLLHLEYKVRYVRNITDVGHIVDDVDEGEDKIAKKARLEQLEPMEVVQRYTVDFHRILSAFNFLPPSIEPTATGHIIEQIEIIKKIIDNGFAYEANGSIYFDVVKFNEDHHYGILSGRNIEDMLANTRDLDGQSDKRNPQDFALWKKAEPQHIMRWPSPWSDGFPGWHLECTAMSTKYLGNHFDIHGGGSDLMFPHHENEIAQSEASTGEQYVNYWMHVGFINVDGEKMSKSLGNFFTIRDVMEKFHPEVIRYFIVSSHYRSPVNFSDVALKEAKTALSRFYHSFKAYQQTYGQKTVDALDQSFVERFNNAMCDDFNTAEAMAVLFELNKELNRAVKEEQAEQATVLYSTLRQLTNILGLVQHDVDEFLKSDIGQEALTLSDAEIEDFIQQRVDAKKAKDFAKADSIRQSLLDQGVVLEDTRQGTIWRRAD